MNAMKRHVPDPEHSSQLMVVRDNWAQISIAPIVERTPWTGEASGTRPGLPGTWTSRSEPPAPGTWFPRERGRPSPMVCPSQGSVCHRGLSVTGVCPSHGRIWSAPRMQRNGRTVPSIGSGPAAAGSPRSRRRLARMWRDAEMVASQGFRASSARIFSRVCSRVSAPTWRSRIEPCGSTNAVNGSAADRLP